MKRNPITLITGGVLVVIFVLMLFAFQVRQTEVAVVTTFGQFSRSITNAGFQTRLPWPIQKVYTFDKRVQVFERKFEQTMTHDGITILAMVYAGWRVSDPKLYLESLSGDPAKTEMALETAVRGAQSVVIPRHDFSELISTNTAELKFDDIEKEMLAGIQKEVRQHGIEVPFVGIKQLGLPESISARVFERMRSERAVKVRTFQSEGDMQARLIRSKADQEANRIIQDAQAEAIKITGAAAAQASAYYGVMQQNPELATFLFQLDALEQSLTNRTTLILDQQTAPFNLMRQNGTSGVNSGN